MKGEIDMGKEEIKIKVESNTLGAVDDSEFNPSAIVDNYDASFEVRSAGKIIIPRNLQVFITGRSFGGRLGAERIRLSMLDQFLTVYGDSYYKNDVSEVDLIKLQDIGEEHILYAIDLSRALDIYDTYCNINAVIGKQMVKTLGWDWQDISTHKQEYIDTLNSLIEIINAKFFFARTVSLDKLIYLHSRIFVSDNNSKTDFTAFSMATRTWIDESDGTCDLGTDDWVDLLGVRRLRKLSDVERVRSSLETFSLSLWYNNVAPFLKHIYSNSNNKGLFTLDKYDRSRRNAFVFVYNENVNELIRNIQLTGRPYITSDDAYFTKCLTVSESNSGSLLQGAVNDDQQCVCFCNTKIVPTDGNTGKSELVNLIDYPVTKDHFLAVMSGLATYNLGRYGRSGVVNENIKPFIMTPEYTGELYFFNCVYVGYDGNNEAYTQYLHTTSIIHDFESGSAAATFMDDILIYCYNMEVHSMDDRYLWTDMHTSLSEMLPSQSRSAALPIRIIDMEADSNVFDMTTEFFYSDLDNFFPIAEEQLRSYLRMYNYYANALEMDSSKPKRKGA